MSITGFLLLLGSAFSWSGFDFTRKKLTQKMTPWPLAFFLHLGQVPLFLAWVLLDDPFLDSQYWPYGTLMILISTIASACFLGAIKLGQLSKTIPLLAFSPVFAISNARWLLSEMPTDTQLFGIAIIIFGGLALHSHALLSRRTIENFLPAGLMLFTAYLWSLTTVLDKKALLFTSPSFHGFVENSGSAIVVGLGLLVLGKRSQIKLLRSDFRVYLVACILASFALGLQLLAVMQMPAAVFDAGKRCFGTLSSLLLGALLFKEDVYKRHWLAALLLCVGILILSFG